MTWLSSFLLSGVNNLRFYCIVFFTEIHKANIVDPDLTQSSAALKEIISETG